MPQTVQKIKRSPGRAPSLIGWNGIYLEAPPDWDLAAVSGTMDEGNLRVDGPGEMTIRVRWKRQKGTVRVQPILDQYLKSIGKKARKSPAGFESSTDVRLPVHRDQEKRKPLFFSWRSEVQAVGLIWHCPSCGRVTIAQIDGPLKRNLTVIAAQVLGTLDDHAMDGCHTWAAYGLAAELPADFAEVGKTFLSGHIQLKFTRGRSSIQLDRWGMADVVLRNADLEAWLRFRCEKGWKGYRCTVEEAEIRGHRGLMVTGELRSLRDRAAAAAMKTVRMSAATRLTQFAWRCEDTNRICSVLAHHSLEEEALTEEIASSFVCHN